MKKAVKHFAHYSSSYYMNPRDCITLLTLKCLRQKLFYDRKRCLKSCHARDRLRDKGSKVLFYYDLCFFVLNQATSWPNNFIVLVH